MDEQRFGPDDDFISAALTDGQLAARLLAAQPALPYASIYSACAAGDAAAAAKLIGTGAVSVFAFGGPRRWPPLLYACYSQLNAEPQRHAGLAQCAALLLERGADPNASWIDPQWPACPQPALYGAAGVHCNPQLVRTLLEHGARTQDGESIYHAAQHNHVACLEVLAEFGADFSAAQPPWNNTPLFFLLGAWPDDPLWPQTLEGIRWLLEHGADPKVPSTTAQETPLHRAARMHGAEVAGLLLEHGADPLARDSADVTPLQVALRYGNAEALEELRRRGADFEPSELDRLMAACAAGDAEHARALLQASPQLLEAVAQQHADCLCTLAALGRDKALAAYLQLGVTPAIRGAEGHTPLHSACWFGRLEAARVLVEGGAPLDVRDGDYDATPLDWVCHGSLNAPGREQKDYAALARLLLDAGAPRPATPWGSDSVKAALSG